MPQTDDMISYGKPFAVTVRSWGTSFLTLAGITNITLQRGGADSVFNKYILNKNKAYLFRDRPRFLKSAGRKNDYVNEIV